jgi:hypothetical protein
MITRMIQLKGRRPMRTILPGVLLGLALIALPASAQLPLGDLFEQGKRAVEEKVLQEAGKLTKPSPEKPKASPAKEAVQQKPAAQADAPTGSVTQFVTVESLPKDSRGYITKVRELAKACEAGDGDCSWACKLAASKTPGHGRGSESERQCVNGYNAMMSAAGSPAKINTPPAASAAKANSAPATSPTTGKPSQPVSSSKDPAVQYCYSDRLMSRIYDCGCVEGVIPSIRAELAQEINADKKKAAAGETYIGNVSTLPRDQHDLKKAKEDRAKMTDPKKIAAADNNIARLEKKISAATTMVDPASIDKESVTLKFTASGNAMCRVSDGVYQDTLASCMEGASMMSGKDPKQVCACTAKKVATDWSAGKIRVYTQESIIAARTEAMVACAR